MADETEPDFEAEFDAHWFTPRAALESLAERGVRKHFAIDTLLRRLLDKQLTAVARSVVISKQGKPEDPLSFRAMPLGAWRGIYAPEQDHHRFWTVGDLTTKENADSYNYSVTYSFLDVRFDPEGLAKIAPAQRALTDGPPPATSLPHAGGRPKWDRWDDRWAEIGARLYNGDLKPTKQTDIEDAMNEVSEQMGGPKEASIRVRARKLWAALKRG